MGKEAGPHRLHQEQAAAAGRRDKVLGLPPVDCEGLLHEHGLAGLEGELGGGVVRGVRDGDVDDVEVAVGRQLLMAPVRPGRADAGGERVRPLRRAGGDGDEFARLGSDPQIGGEGGGDATGPDDAPPHGPLLGGAVAGEQFGHWSSVRRRAIRRPSRPRPPLATEKVSR